MNLPALGNRIRRDFGQLLRQNGLNRVMVTIHYEKAGTADIDPNLEEDIPDKVVYTVEVPALVHYVSPESVVQRGFTEISAGDAIVDFAHDAPLDTGKANVRFEIEGRMWEQKHTGRDLTLAWDTLVGGLPTCRTVLLSPGR